MDIHDLEEFDPVDYITSQEAADAYMADSRKPPTTEEIIRHAEETVRRAGFEVR